MLSAECFSSAEANQAKDRHSPVDSSDHSDSLALDLEAVEHSDLEEVLPGIQAQRFPRSQARNFGQTRMAPQRLPIFCSRLRCEAGSDWLRSGPQQSSSRNRSITGQALRWWGQDRNRQPLDLVLYPKELRSLRL